MLTCVFSEMFNGFKIPTNNHVGSHFLDEIMKESLNKDSPKAQDDTKVEEPQVHQEKELETVGVSIYIKQPRVFLTSNFICF